MSFSRSPLLLCSFFLYFNRDVLTYAFTPNYGLMVKSAFFDTSNAQSQFALKFKTQCNSVRSNNDENVIYNSMWFSVRYMLYFQSSNKFRINAKFLPEPTGTNSYQSYVLWNSWLVLWSLLLSLIMLLINTITSSTYRNDRRTLFLKMPEDKFFSLFSSRVLLQENISKCRFS